MRQSAERASQPLAPRLIQVQNKKHQQRGAVGHRAPPPEEEDPRVCGLWRQWEARGRHRSESWLHPLRLPLPSDCPFPTLEDLPGTSSQLSFFLGWEEASFGTT